MNEQELKDRVIKIIAYIEIKGVDNLDVNDLPPLLELSKPFWLKNLTRAKKTQVILYEAIQFPKEDYKDYTELDKLYKKLHDLLDS